MRLINRRPVGISLFLALFVFAILTLIILQRQGILVSFDNIAERDLVRIDERDISPCDVSSVSHGRVEFLSPVQGEVEAEVSITDAHTQEAGNIYPSVDSPANRGSTGNIPSIGSNPDGREVGRPDVRSLNPELYDRTQALIESLNISDDTFERYRSPLSASELRQAFKGADEVAADAETVIGKQNEFWSRSSSIEDCVRRIIRNGQNMQSSHADYEPLIPLAYYDRYASPVLVEILEKGRTEESGANVAGFNNITPGVAAMLAQLKDNRSVEAFSSIVSSLDTINPRWRSSLYSDATFSLLETNALDPSTVKFVEPGAYPELLYFIIGQTEDPAFLPYLIQSLKYYEWREKSGASNLLTAIKKMAIAFNLVRCSRFSFRTKEENLLSGNWVALLDDLGGNDLDKTNYFNESFNSVMKELDLITEADALVARISHGYTYDVLRGSISLSIYDMKASSLHVSQFGSAKIGDIIDKYDSLSDDREGVSKKVLLLQALIAIGGSEVENFLDRIIRMEQWQYNRLNWFAHINQRSFLGYPVMMPEYIAYSPYQLAIYGATYLRSEFCLDALNARYEQSSDWIEKGMLLLCHAFIKPDDKFVPDLIGALADSHIDVVRPSIIWALVLHSGHTFGSPEADSDPVAWENWWNTPAEFRAR
ncbi:MAG: hypothetical protein NUW37_02145 [Planctomycetes bacterium]|nr:hypothetical protein [Planctomycetota bacterium]